MLLDTAKRSSVKEADAEEVVKKWLKAASDRQGGRQRRLEKKQGMQFLILQSKVIAITLFVCVCVCVCVSVCVYFRISALK